jgi:hypothetical protein
VSDFPAERQAEIEAHLEEAVAFYARQGQPADAIARRPEALVLRYGQPFRGTPWSTWRGRGWRRRKAKQCFHNAMDYSYRDGLSYAEGYAADISVVHHAWCVTEDGRVVDPTWHDTNEETEYFGIVFPQVLSANLYLAEKGKHLDALMLADHEQREAWLAELREGGASSE